MCTVHANSAREAITKLSTLPLLAGQNVSHAFVVPTVAASIDLVVHLRTDRFGQRRVTEICGVPGRVEGAHIEISEIFATRGGQLVRGSGWPPRRERFDAAGFDLSLLLGTDEQFPEQPVELLSGSV